MNQKTNSSQLVSSPLPGYGRFLPYGTTIAALFAFLAPRLPSSDPVTYFDFADKRGLFGIPNFGDVVSNMPFAMVGLMGLKRVLQWRKAEPESELSGLALVFCIGVTAVSAGSAYFHWNPNSETLVWDRLPMAVSFTSLLALLLSDRVSPAHSKALATALTTLGVLSVWNVAYGFQDLRPYFILQFGTMAVMLVLLLFFRSGRLPQGPVFGMLGFYVLAKVLESADKAIFENGAIVSGHTLKHLAAAVSIFFLIRSWPPRPVVRS